MLKHFDILLVLDYMIRSGGRLRGGDGAKPGVQGCHFISFLMGVLSRCSKLGNLVMNLKEMSNQSVGY